MKAVGRFKGESNCFYLLTCLIDGGFGLLLGFSALFLLARFFIPIVGFKEGIDHVEDEGDVLNQHNGGDWSPEETDKDRQEDGES